MPVGSRPATEWMAVASSASSKVSGGRMVATRRAIIVLPAPGWSDHEHVVAAGRGDLQGATRQRLSMDVGEVAVEPARWRRAPATVFHRTHGTSADRSAPRRPRSTNARGRARAPRRQRPRRGWDGGAASRETDADGLRRRSAARRAPPECRHRATTRRGAARPRCRAAQPGLPRRARRERLAGRRTSPALRMSAGARLTVTRCGGNSKPELRIALRTRSRLSRTLASGKPTI